MKKNMPLNYMVPHEKLHAADFHQLIFFRVLKSEITMHHHNFIVCFATIKITSVFACQRVKKDPRNKRTKGMNDVCQRRRSSVRRCSLIDFICVNYAVQRSRKSFIKDDARCRTHNWILSSDLENTIRWLSCSLISSVQWTTLFIEWKR